MARWALINEAGQVTDYRTTGGDFVYDPNEYGNLPNGLPVMRPLEEAPLPTYDPETYELGEQTPTVFDDKVVLDWSVVPRDPAVIAEEQRIDALKTESDVVDLANRLKTASPAQINTWIDSNVTNLAQARAVLKAIVKLLAYALRSI